MRLFSCFILAITLHSLPAQICKSVCTGNLGENIFPGGDFGSGVANVLATDPKLAPGYSYTTNPPPNDGYYTITNNTTSWGWFAASDWIDIPDNSKDPNGYMMVVNASYTPGLFFEKKVPVCENTLYEFSIDVISIAITRPGYNPILPNLSFLIDGKIACSTGDVIANSQWYTYRFSFNTAPGTSEVTLSLRNNAPGGLGNDLAIDNISFRACGPEITLPVTVSYCKDTPIEIKAQLANSPYNDAVYQWQRNAPAGWQDIAGATATRYVVPTPVSGDVYRLVVANSPGNLARTYCRAVSFPVKLALEDLSTFQIVGADTIVCNGAPAILEAGQHKRYRWTTGDTTVTTKAAAPGWYSVGITTKNGCTANDSIYVYEVRLEGDAAATNPQCYGYSNGRIQIKNLSGGTGPLRFSVKDGSWQNSTLFDSLAAGNYRVTLTDSLGCDVKIALKIENPPKLQVVIKGQNKLTEGNSVLLEAQANFQVLRYEWYPSIYLNCISCNNTTASPLRDTTYMVRATDADGCFALDTLVIKVEPNRNLYAPNVFRPNGGDNGNGYFSVFPVSQDVIVKELSIFDRWGTLMFQRKNLPANDLNLRWDGTLPNGKTAASGVYTWMAELIWYDGLRTVRSGDILLVE